MCVSTFSVSYDGHTLSTRPTLRSRVSHAEEPCFYCCYNNCNTSSGAAIVKHSLDFFGVSPHLFATCFREIVVTVFLLVDCVPRFCTQVVSLPWENCDFEYGQLL